MTLIERLETATGPDRGLDAEIAVASGWARNHDGVAYRLHPYIVGAFIDDANAGCMHTCPRFSASIDAALTLVPEGWDWGIGAMAGKGFALLAKPNSTKPGVTVTNIATPALAICIAALKAREGAA